MEMTAKFGIEIEFLGMGDNCAVIKNNLVRDGIFARTYAEQNREFSPTAWKVTYDGSVMNEDNCDYPYCDECDEYGCGCYEPSYEQGAELVSPILKVGQSSYDEVAKIMASLKKSHCYVNETCGLHVHVDARFVAAYNEPHRREFFQYLIDSYAELEDELDMRMESHRREDNSEYCASMIRKKFANVISCRYHKLNICAFSKHGTVEFRHHHGTLNSEEAINWIKFCVGFMKKARRAFNSKIRHEALMARSASMATVTSAAV